MRLADHPALTQSQPDGELPVDRRAAVQAAMRAEGVSALLLVGPANIAYVSGFRPTPFERFLALVVPREGGLRLVTPALEKEPASARMPVGSEIYLWRDDESPRAALKSAFSGVDGPVGVEKQHLTIAGYELIAGTLPFEAFGDCGPLLAGLRAVKDETEIVHLRAAAAIVDRTLELVSLELRPGRTEVELAALATRLLSEHGEPPPFEPLVLAGPKSAHPHGKSDGSRIEAGDLVIVDLCSSVRGYCADVTRTFVCGREAVGRQRELFDVVRSAQASAIEAAVTGALLADVDRAARSVITRAGFGDHFVHRTGHGLGLEVHEPPSIHGASTERLPAGAVVTIEPGVYLPGYGGVRIEDDILVRQTSSEVLTRAPISLEPAA